MRRVDLVVLFDSLKRDASSGDGCWPCTATRVSANKTKTTVAIAKRKDDNNSKSNCSGDTSFSGCATLKSGTERYGAAADSAHALVAHMNR